MENQVRKISQEEIEQFINGTDPMERIVNLEYKNQDNFITIYYRNEADQKCKTTEPFYPFVWATLHACVKLCNGNRQQLKKLMGDFKIGCKKLSNIAIDGTVREEFNDGYMYMFYAKSPMSYSDFLRFFKKANNPIYPNRDKDGNNIYESKLDERQYLIVTPQEQFMIKTGKRFFKGYNDYDQLLRMTFDLETEGLDKEHHRIKQLGIKFNRPFHNHPNGFQRVFNLEGTTEEEKNKSELKIIETFFQIIYTFQPDIVCGHNIENFDNEFLIKAAIRLGTTIEEISAKYFNGETFHKENRETILKLGGEIETFRPTVCPGTIITDSLHAVRRAQALDSNMQRADLKYATKYSGMVKFNRVYTPGDKIDQILTDTVNKYAFNDHDGDWYIYDPVNGSSIKTLNDFNSEKEYHDYIKSIKGKQGDEPYRMHTFNTLLDGYEIVTGKYIIERYLYDDLWEGDRVEWKFNSTNFLICKMLPIPYKKCTIGGTAVQWKSLILSWSYYKGLSVPQFGEQKPFTGGLSRLLKTGFINKQIKNDFNSLYPSIIITWWLSSRYDLLDTIPSFLEYVLTTREYHKGKKKEAEKRVDALKDKILNNTATEEEIIEYNQARADFEYSNSIQTQMKVLANSIFGAMGNKSVFPWGSLQCAETITCIGRQSLRLMISHFSNIGNNLEKWYEQTYGEYNREHGINKEDDPYYQKLISVNSEEYNYVPVVGDSVTPDTPLFIKYKDNGFIDIKPISELIDGDQIQVDALGREYDYSEKGFYVLCRSGWVKPSYIYRHKTNKNIYRIKQDDGSYIDITEDHSLFTENKEEIRPTEIEETTKMEINTHSIYNYTFNNNADINPILLAHKTATDGNRVPCSILNASQHTKKIFYYEFIKCYNENICYSKTCLAGIKYIRKSIGK